MNPIKLFCKISGIISEVGISGMCSLANGVASKTTLNLSVNIKASISAMIQPAVWIKVYAKPLRNPRKQHSKIKAIINISSTIISPINV